jgi:GNAT superfamily N-acetyltransferase
MEYIEIEDLCVDKNRQNRGTGKKLFEWAAAYAKAEGINRMELSVWAFNKNAAGFYEHLGMQTRTSRMEITL